MSKEISFFEIATREKYRFPYKGAISVEDLWDLPLEGLDTIFKNLNKRVKQSREESLLETKSAADEQLDNQIAIVRYIVATKQREAAHRLAEKEIREERQCLMELIDKKDKEELEGLSKEELLKRLAELE